MNEPLLKQIVEKSENWSSSDLITLITDMQLFIIKNEIQTDKEKVAVGKKLLASYQVRLRDVVL